jgi:hypothetical protein
MKRTLKTVLAMLIVFVSIGMASRLTGPSVDYLAPRSAQQTPDDSARAGTHSNFDRKDRSANNHEKPEGLTHG